MLPLILLAAGAYIIGEAVLEDDKYADGGKIPDGKKIYIGDNKYNDYEIWDKIGGYIISIYRKEKVEKNGKKFTSKKLSETVQGFDNFQECLKYALNKSKEFPDLYFEISLDKLVEIKNDKFLYWSGVFHRTDRDTIPMVKERTANDKIKSALKNPALPENIKEKLNKIKK